MITSDPHASLTIMMAFGSCGYREKFESVAGAVMFLWHIPGKTALRNTINYFYLQGPRLRGHYHRPRCWRRRGQKAWLCSDAHVSGWVGRLWQSPFCFLPRPLGWKETGFLLGPYPGKRKNTELLASPKCLLLLGTWCRAKTWGLLLWGRRGRLHFSEIRPWDCLQPD